MRRVEAVRNSLSGQFGSMTPKAIVVSLVLELTEGEKHAFPTCSPTPINTHTLPPHKTRKSENKFCHDWPCD